MKPETSPIKMMPPNSLDSFKKLLAIVIKREGSIKKGCEKVGISHQTRLKLLKENKLSSMTARKIIKTYEG
jgi:molybdenum-dependent DNA-binding transcriptional regulator ModE